jgi:hypothetical protein
MESLFTQTGVKVRFLVTDNKVTYTQGRASYPSPTNVPNIGYMYEYEPDNSPETMVKSEFSMSSCSTPDLLATNKAIETMVQVEKNFHELQTLVNNLVELGMPLGHIQTMMCNVYGTDQIRITEDVRK